VDTSLINVEKHGQTGYALLLVAENGERVALAFRGASGDFHSYLLPKNKIRTKWLFITTLSGNTNLLKELVDWAEGENVKVAIIPGSAELKKGPRVLGPIFAKTDVVVMNHEEAATLTGVPFDKKEKVVQKTCLLTRQLGVITDGPYGATACDRDFFYQIGTHKNKAIDRTGAGDAFASGFVAGLIKYGTVEGALELAVDNASNVVNFHGAKRGIIKAGEKPFKDRLTAEKIKS
jgi:ribokinase